MTHDAEFDGPSIRQKVDTYLEARRAAVEFLLAHANADGSIGPTAEGVFYARIPWVLALAGETVAATRLVSWIRRHMLTSEGELAGAASPEHSDKRTINTYDEALLAYGAHLLCQFDVAERAMGFALRYQDPETGGVFMDRERTGPDGPQLLFLTCQFGMSALITGRKGAAAAAGTWLQRLWDEQPELPDRLYTVTTRSGGLATRVPAQDDRCHYVNEGQEVREMHYNGGIAAAFLTRLFLATGDRAWRELAREYQAFSMHSTGRQFETMQVCKSGWGGALLYQATGEPHYRDWTIKLGDWFVANQFGDGHWENSRYLEPEPQLPGKLAITAEFINHLDSIAAALGRVDVAGISDHA